jgi:hypothetical protein
MFTRKKRERQNTTKTIQHGRTQKIINERTHFGNPPRSDNKTYNAKDYESNDGMLTSVWGPGMWHYLHTMSFNYPVRPTPQQKAQYRNFILQLQYVLPCGKCRKNLKRNFRKMPLTMEQMESRETFSKYIYQLHELVNKMLNKESGMTYEMVRERYEHFRARCALPYKMLPKHRTLKHTANNEKGCTEPLYGEKSKCILKIVPESKKCKTLHIDKKCIKQKISVGGDPLHAPYVAFRG